MNRELRAKTRVRTVLEKADWVINRFCPAVLHHQLSMPESKEGAGVTIVFVQINIQDFLHSKDVTRVNC